MNRFGTMTRPCPTHTAETSNRDRLRHATRDAHITTERLWLPHGRFTDRVNYTEWLFALWRVHNQLGRAATEALPNARFAAEEGTRRAALKQDLELDAAAVRSGPKAPSSGWAWGVLYALNGSALGASGLLRSGGLAADWPSSYLQTMQTYAKSGELRTFFDQLNDESSRPDAMIDGANEVFQALIDLTR